MEHLVWDALNENSRRSFCVYRRSRCSTAQQACSLIWSVYTLPEYAQAALLEPVHIRFESAEGR
jgi:hypothetical protein